MAKFETLAIVSSLSSSGTNPTEDVVTIIHENGANDVIAEYKGMRYTAIFNAFVCRYYVDDRYGKLKDQNKCPLCGETLPEKTKEPEQ
jgi:hypothetical protein